jgi:hypothetical protein
MGHLSLSTGLPYLLTTLDLQVEKEEEDGTGGLTVWEAGKDGMGAAEDLASAAAAGGLFGDAETRAFYEELPDLLSLVPLTILGLSSEQVGSGRRCLSFLSPSLQSWHARAHFVLQWASSPSCNHPFML